MSYRSLMKHRCTILRQDVDLKTGSPTYAWTEVRTNVPCFFDLNFIRKGKDPMWTAEAGRSSDRSGVAFFLGTAPVMNGDWLKVTKGPAGVFSIETAIDEAWRPTDKHHLEISVSEIPKQLASPQVGASYPTTEVVPQFPSTNQDNLKDIDALSVPSPFDDIPGMD